MDPSSPSAIPDAQEHSPPQQNRTPTKPIKIKKPPNITPRRFKKLFTPQPKKEDKKKSSALQRLRSVSVRRNGHTTAIEEGMDLSQTEPGKLKRKRETVDENNDLPVLPTSTTDDSEAFLFPSSQDYPDGSSRIQSQASIDVDDVDEEDDTNVRVKPIQRYGSQSLSKSILSMRLNGQRRSRRIPDQNLDWEHEAGRFYSTADDYYSCSENQRYALPFSTAACNTNSVVAVGSEHGTVSLIDSAKDAQDGLSKAFLTFTPHDNALMDLEFSTDDSLLATGSGDQTCRITDMQTQRIVNRLDGHAWSVKRVLFQPGSMNKVVATCGRDGLVNLWDLRISDKASRPNMYGPLGRSGAQLPNLVNSFRVAQHNQTTPTPSGALNGETSATSMAFLGADRSHCLATASGIDSTVQLWDLRITHDFCRARAFPVSRTKAPAGHRALRDFGLTSMALSGDTSRLYTYCRDHTIYVYSTAHLVLGSAPELDTPTGPARSLRGASREGLGPLYGFRHAKLQSTSFFTKLAIRKAKDGQSELLAAGSSSDCAVIFPTDERYLTARARDLRLSEEEKPRLQRLRSQTRSAKPGEAEPIYRHGTALIEGHRKEVTAVTWTSDGNLMTASDDFKVRCWREGNKARELRQPDEVGGGRWRCGWADVSASFDAEYLPCH